MEGVQAHRVSSRARHEHHFARYPHQGDGGVFSTLYLERDVGQTL
jgi:transposase